VFQPIFAFLHALRLNNNHEWFEAHRPEYEEARELFDDFIQGLIFRFDAIEPLGDLAAKDAIFRIGSDMRFAKNQATLQKPLLSRARSRRQALFAAALLHPHHAGRLFPGGRRAHAHLRRSASLSAPPFAWRSRRDSRRPNVSSASNLVT
jgi:uncharacterized protein (DUF2461 family)